jgi:hypothetical protein
MLLASGNPPSWLVIHSAATVACKPLVVSICAVDLTQALQRPDQSATSVALVTRQDRMATNAELAVVVGLS